MDLAHFLNERLEFVEYFHTMTTASFDEVKSKIEAGEPPYVDTRDPEYAEEPAFLEEWERADAAMAITGAACLDLLQSTFHAFLDEYMDEIGNKQVIPQLKEMGRKSWFQNYRAFFEKYLQIHWAASGADLDLLEQVILTRNDFTHNIDLLSLNAFQTPFHSHKYPDSAFADQRWKTLFMGRTRLIVPGETLRRAIGTVRTLCEYLDRERYELMRRWRTERKAKEGKK
jgi:hypothetical protein